MKNPRFVAAALTASCALLAAPVTHAAAGDLYVSAVPLVLKVTAGIASPFSSATLLPSGVAFDQSGNLFAADATANLILKLTPAGSQSTFLGTGLNSPRGLAFDATGNLYIANSGTNSILKVTPGGVSTTFTTGLSAPRGLAFDVLGNLYIANSGNNTIAKVTPDGTKTTFVSTDLNIPFGLAFDANGILFVSNIGSSAIVKVDAERVVSSFVDTGLNSPEGLAFDASGNLFVADFGSGAVLKITPGGIVTIDVPGLVGPQFLALSPTVHQFYNISTRGYVQTGNRVLIAGLIIRGDPVGDLGSMSVLVRAIGPDLTGFGISDALADPTLELYNASGQLIASNNDWKSSQQSDIEATGLAPHDDHDAAILATLPDGNYTTVVKGANGTVGTALIEAYKTEL
jgi:streptogramin lyase